MNQSEKEAEPAGRTFRDKATVAIDPVCGMDVDREAVHIHHEYKGETYYFCSGYCLGMFCSTPARYAQGADPILYECAFCGLHYKERERVEKCEAWCRIYSSCNLEITHFAEERRAKNGEGKT